MLKRIPLVIGVALLLFCAYLIFSAPADSVVIIHSQVGPTMFTVELAQTQSERERGLMNRDRLANDQGMLFIFSNSDIRSFWMKDTYIPLDILFLNNEFEIIHIENNVQPCQLEPCTVYSSKLPAQYVLEIKGGLSKVRQIQLGDRVELIR